MTKLDKFFGDKKNSSIIYLLLAMGIMLMLYGNLGKSQPAAGVSAPPDSKSREAELILSEIKGAGVVRVMISVEEGTGSVVSDEPLRKKSSVLIVADGGSDSHVREKIILAASAALGVDSHKIQVFERKD